MFRLLRNFHTDFTEADQCPFLSVYKGVTIYRNFEKVKQSRNFVSLEAR